jgi:hypothetical protein
MLSLSTGLRCGLCAAVFFVSFGAAAQEPTWTVLPMAPEGVDIAAASTFRDLLEAELMTGARVRFVPAPAPCFDIPCARYAAQHTGARVVVFGRLRPLGHKIVAQVTMVDGQSGRVLGSANQSADGVDGLDTVAREFARRLLAGGPSDLSTLAPGTTALPPSAPAGSPTPSPTEEPSTSASALLRVAGVAPLRDDAPVQLGMGMAFDLGVWIEGSMFAVEPRTGVRFDARHGDSSSYVVVPFDVGAFFLPDIGDIAPFVGGGAGFRYMTQTRSRDVQLGSVMITEHRGESRASGVDWGLYGRAGVVFLRRQDVHIVLSGDYDVTFLRQEDGSYAKSFLFGMGVVL